MSNDELAAEIRSLRALLFTLVANLSPDMRFHEVHEMLKNDSEDTTRAWLRKHKVQQTRHGRYLRSAVILAVTQPPPRG